MDSRDGSWPLGSKIRRKTRRALLRRDPPVHARTYDVPHRVQGARTCSRPTHACGARPARWDGRPGSAGGRGGRELTSPATKRAWWVSSAVSAMHRYATLREVGWEEGESAHRKSAVAAPSRSAPPPATIRGPYGSSCDAASTPRGRQGGWTVTGGTGMIGRRGTPASSSKVVGDEDLGHQQCCGDRWKRPGQREHLRATCRHVAALSSQEWLTVRIRKVVLHLQSQGCRGRG